jgi:acetoin utilization deacetylase AcuC-like enzyme
MATGFYWDENCFWHAGGSYALTLPVGDFVQPLAAGGLPENPETKRRFKNLLDVSGLLAELEVRRAPAATAEDLLRVHPESYLNEFRQTSDAGGGELGLRTPFLKGGFEIAALSAGMAKAALFDVLDGVLDNAYALSRPPGHHCLPDWPNGFCLLNNIGIAIEAAKAAGKAQKFAVIDWDVHHGNGTEAVFYDRSDVLTISLHQERNYPLDTGDFADQGRGNGTGFNVNVPLPPGTGHTSYLHAIEKIVLPKLAQFQPDVIIVACGFDASIFDPLAHMMCTAETFRAMTAQMMQAAEELCGGKLVLVHEGGYSEAYVPFCGHAVMEQLSGSQIKVPDPMAATVATRQPGPRSAGLVDTMIDEMAAELGLAG